MVIFFSDDDPPAKLRSQGGLLFAAKNAYKE